MYIGLVQLVLGNTDEALALLETEYDHRSAQMAYIHVDPLFAALHGNERFERIIKKMNFPK
jgi:hypothetical protein